MQSFDYRPLCDLSSRVLLFPVRHHSPTASRLVAALIHQVRPSAVLIECASDYNERLDELALPHQPPIALYSYVRLEDGTRQRGVLSVLRTLAGMAGGSGRSRDRGGCALHRLALGRHRRCGRRGGE